MLLLAIRFAVEVLGVIGLGYLGATVPAGFAPRLALGIGAPLALLAVWSLVVAPKARNPIPVRARELIGTALLVAVALALALAGQPGWGAGLAAIATADQILILAFDADGLAATLGANAPQGGE
jgi:hypothetical protein